MKPVSFAVFFVMWSNLRGWKVPDLHVRICLWLENCTDPVRVLKVFRGAAKSTIFAVYKAWRLYRDRTIRNQIWAADDKTATRLTRDTLAVLRRHPLCAGMLPPKPGEKFFWVTGSTDFRNPSMEANGVLSNATGSRADAIDFDDIEVPKNIRKPEARESLRSRIDDSTHILVPGGQNTYIGTPHTHDSIYDEQIQGGAAVLEIPLFEHAVRYEATDERKDYTFNFKVADDGLYVFVGIGKFARLLVEGWDYKVKGKTVVFAEPPQAVLDIYTGCAWPERFDRADLETRRKKTRTLNGWDSQYQLHAKPSHEMRLDPDRIIEYDVEPQIIHANGGVRMMLGQVQIVGAKCWWDCSLGKVKSDTSALALVFTDAQGRLYWHRAVGLTGDLEELDAKGKLIGGQCKQAKDLIVKFQLGQLTIETNGPGGFVPAIMRKHLKGTGCGVKEYFTTENKQEKILDAFEAPLSSKFLWAHSSVLAGPAWDEMRDFNPAEKNQPDDYIDSAAGAIKETPVRIGKFIADEPQHMNPVTWRPNEGVYEVELVEG
jgi:hypothetical protein